jgi:hypothetical protein
MRKFGCVCRSRLYISPATYLRLSDTKKIVRLITIPANDPPLASDNTRICLLPKRKDSQRPTQSNITKSSRVFSRLLKRCNNVRIQSCITRKASTPTMLTPPIETRESALYPCKRNPDSPQSAPPRRGRECEIFMRRE